MVDRLPKTIWLSMHHVLAIKHWLVQSKWLLVKDFPNLFMAGSLPKTIKQSNDPPLSRGYTLGSGEDSLELKELMNYPTYLLIFSFIKWHSWNFATSIIWSLILVKSESSEGFDEIIDFLTSSHIYYALTENPIIFVSLLNNFGKMPVFEPIVEGLQAISATIDGYETLITEASLRRHLKLEDAKGIFSLSNEEIFEQLAHMGYATNSESLTFFKEFFPIGSSLSTKFYMFELQE
ncbi:hypothetical protein Tco_0710736 [Tanacetum coccineum]